MIFDKNTNAGGSLRNLPETELPTQALTEEIGYIQNYGVDSALGTALDEFVVWADALHSPEASGETEELTL